MREFATREAARMTRFAVVGHVEWIEFGRFSHVPEPGEIIDATEWFSEAAGSAAVVAVQLAKLSGDVDFFTALGDDERGRRAAERLDELGVRVHAAPREAMQRWGFVHLDDDGERTISIVGERHAPHGDDDLPWERLDGADAVFVSGGDAAAMREARRAQLLVATPRAAEALQRHPHRRARRQRQGPPRAARPRRARPAARARDHHRRQGGRHLAGAASSAAGTFKAAELPGPLVDEYGAGDTFAAGVTYALGAGYEIDDALAFAARAGAANLTGRGPYAGQLTADERDPLGFYAASASPRAISRSSATASSIGASAGDLRPHRAGPRAGRTGSSSSARTAPASPSTPSRRMPAPSSAIAAGVLGLVGEQRHDRERHARRPSPPASSPSRRGRPSPPRAA